MVVASRIVLLWLIIGLPLGILATVGLVYLIRHLAQSGRKEPEQPKEKELDKMKIEDL